MERWEKGVQRKMEKKQGNCDRKQYNNFHGREKKVAEKGEGKTEAQRSR
jgi:hypothetical protein